MDLKYRILRIYRMCRIFLRFNLGLTRRELNGILIIYPVGLLLMWHWSPVTGTLQEDQRSLELAYQTLTTPAESPVKPWEPFDPDTVTLASLEAHGVDEPLARRWLNYREKAGGFTSTGQLKQLYGMTDSLYANMVPHIRISNPQPQARYVPVNYREPFDINLADTTLWQSLRGIGPVLSKRIVAYRKILGGFMRVEQLREVYGIDSALFDAIRPQLYVMADFEPQKILLTDATYQELRAHPYLSPRQASAIIHYRSQHGVPESADYLGNIALLDSSTISRVRPYLAFRE